MKRLVFVSIILLLLSSCGYQKLLVYEPSAKEEISTFFSNGIPIGSFSSEDEFLLFSVDETSLFGSAYLRVWLLYENKSSTAYLLEPYNVITLETEKEGEFFAEYLAESPSKILSTIDEQEAATMIFKSIGGALEALTVDGTTIKSNTGKVHKINDEDEKRKIILQQTQNDLENTANWYNLFKNSFSSGVLRKNTVFLNQSVNGYLYFPIAKVNGTNMTYYSTDIKELNFSLLLKSKGISKKIKLVPTAVW